jgi:hypothetical protein
LASVGDLWAELGANGRRSLGVVEEPTVEIDREHPDLRGIETRDLPLALVTCASAAVVVA